jgi:transposase
MRRAEPALGPAEPDPWDGFWLHRLLEAHGMRNHVLDEASLQVNRRARRAKPVLGPAAGGTRGTDRIDVTGLLRALMAHARGEPKVVSPRVRPQAGPRTG